MSGHARRFRGGAVAAVIAVILGSGGQPATAGDESYSADSCAAASDSGEWEELRGSVHNSWDLTDWYGHSSQANQRTITLDSSNDNVNLEVRKGNCTTPALCTTTTPPPAEDRCVITETGLIKIRIVYPNPGAGVGVSSYILRVELPPECRDGYDNDGDHLTDYPFDADCTDPTDPTEAGPLPPACNDRVDNDGDGRIDYPLDQGCTSANDTTENDDPPGGPCPPVALGVVACLTPGSVYLSQAVFLVSPQPTTSHDVVGYVAGYEFTLPTNIRVTLPCVVLTVDSTTDPCRAAGGVPGATVASLVDTTVSEYGVAFGPTLTTVRVCNAALTATVLGLGVNSAPAFTLC